MEVFFETLYFLCLSSAVISLQLTPSLNIKTPIGLDLELGALNTNLLNSFGPKNDDSNSNENCFCIPSNADSQPVISYLNPGKDLLERQVVYLYKINGVVKLYIPNKNKQELIPDLNFDESEGDIIIPVTSQSIIELFDPNNIENQQTVPTFNDELINESEALDMETNNPQPIDINSGIIQNYDYSSAESSDDSIQFENNNIFDEQSIPNDIPLKPSAQVPLEGNEDPNLSIITNLADGEQLPEIVLPLSPQQINSLGSTNSINGQLSNINPILTNSNLRHQPYSMPLFQQNPYNTDSMFNSYITFNDWFDEQLKHIVLYNLDTPNKIIEFRVRIKNLLEGNGIHSSNKGIVTDSNGNLVRMNNLKLRPILIGVQRNLRDFIHDQKHMGKSTVSYLQLIEVIQDVPPKLLGTLILGTVLLPRNLNLGHDFNIWNRYESETTPIKYKIGCVRCKPQQHQGPTYSLTNGLHQSQHPVLYGKYHALPFRRNFKSDKQTLPSQVPVQEQTIASEEHYRQIGDDSNRTGLGSVLDGLLENLGAATSLNDNAYRRILGGVLPNKPKPGPKTHPSDDLPGFRIIGGNAATSSGTPLVNKGRSGYVPPNLII